MKFSQKLSSHLTPEWRSQYINYDSLKSLITRSTLDAPSRHNLTEFFFNSLDEEFFLTCEAELNKINVFFAEKLAESSRKFLALKTELNNVAYVKGKDVSMMNLNTILSKRKCQHFKSAFSELYLQLVLLQNYQTLNHTGFRKILKKYDKVLRSNKGARWFNEHVDNAEFYTNTDIMDMIHETEEIFTINLEGGDRTSAMNRLRVPPLAEEVHPWTSFRVGYSLGALLVLTVLIFISRVLHYIRNSIVKTNTHLLCFDLSLFTAVYICDISKNNFDACIYLFRAPFALSLFLVCLSINVYGFSKVGVNHVLIFELDPRDHLVAVQILEIALGFGVLLCLSILAFLHSPYLYMPPFVFPLALAGVMLGYVLNPLHILHYNARKWLLKVTGRLVSAPFFYVGFADFWLGDQLTSLATCILDYEYTICYYATQSDWYNAKDVYYCRDHIVFIQFVRCLPAWFRFAQCLRRYRDTKLIFPHLWNAGKYVSAIVVGVFAALKRSNSDMYANAYENPYTWLWLLASIVATTYGYAWDILVDWSLFAKNPGDNVFLRDHIVYPQRWYYVAIVEDLLLRLLWIPSFYIYDVRRSRTRIWRSLTGQLEIFRRFIWNFFRLENEHLNNIGQFRAVRDISVKPILKPVERSSASFEELSGVVLQPSTHS